MVLSAAGGPRVNMGSPLDQLFMITVEGLTESGWSLVGESVAGEDRGMMVRWEIGERATHDTLQVP
jgi:hypothetical protein